MKMSLTARTHNAALSRAARGEHTCSQFSAYRLNLAKAIIR